MAAAASALSPAAGCGPLAEAEAVSGRAAAPATQAMGSSRPQRKMDVAPRFQEPRCPALAGSLLASPQPAHREHRASGPLRRHDASAQGDDASAMMLITVSPLLYTCALESGEGGDSTTTSMAAGATSKEARRQLLWAARCPQGQPAACHSLTGSEGPAVTTSWQPSLCFGKRRGRRLDHHLHGCRGCLEGGKTSAPLGGSMSTGAASCLSLADWKRGPAVTTSWQQLERSRRAQVLSARKK